jgi:hypothetical protein
MTIIDGPRRADAYAFHGQASLIEDTTAAVHHLNGKYLHANSIGRVGIELEAHCIDLKDPHRRPTWAEICDVVSAPCERFPAAAASPWSPAGPSNCRGRRCQARRTRSRRWCPTGPSYVPSFPTPEWVWRYSGPTRYGRRSASTPADGDRDRSELTDAVRSLLGLAQHT